MKNQENYPRLAHQSVSLINDHPLRSLLLMTLILAVVIPGFSRLTKDFTHKGFFYDSDPLLQQFLEFESQYGNDDTVLFAIHSPSGIFDKESAQVLKTLTEKLWLVPDIARVTTLANYNWVHAENDEIIIEPFFPVDNELTPALLQARKKIALSHEVLPGYLISEDAKTTLAYGAIRPGNDNPPDASPIIQAVHKLQQELETGDHKIYVSGSPSIINAFEQVSREDLSRLLPVMFALIVFCLFINLRSVVAIILALLVVAVSIALTFGLGGWLGLPVTSATAILPQTLIAIGIADAVHILVVFQQARREGMKQQEAARYSLLKNFQPTVITSISTTIGFLSITSSSVKSLAHLGLMAGIGVLVAWLVTYFILGPLLFIIPIKARVRSQQSIAINHERAKSYITFLSKRHRVILICFSLVSIAAVSLAFQTGVNSDPYKYFVKDYPVRVANDFITEKIGGGRRVEIVIRTGKDDGIKDPEFLNKLDSFQRWIEAKPYVMRTLSIVDIFKATNRSLNNDDPDYYKLPESQAGAAQLLLLYEMGLPEGMDLEDQITEKSDALRLTVLWSLSDSRTWNEETAGIGKKAQEMGFDFTITGKGNLYQLMNPYLVSSFIQSISIALLLISCLLVAVFKSFKLGMIALIPNCIPLVMGGALFYLLDLAMDAGSVLVLSVCLGIAVDDTIHILTNYHRLRQQNLCANDAAVKVLTHTTPALVTTTLILVCGFGTLAFGSFIPNVYFGAMTAVVLCIALFTDLTFLPTLLLTTDSEK